MNDQLTNNMNDQLNKILEILGYHVSDSPK